MQRKKSLIPKHSIGGWIDNTSQKISNYVNDLKLSPLGQVALAALPSLIGGSVLGTASMWPGAVAGAASSPRGQMISQALRGAARGGRFGFGVGAVIPPILFALGTLAYNMLKNDGEDNNDKINISDYPKEDIIYIK